MLRFLCSTLLTSCLISTTALAGEAIKGRAETNLRMGHERSIFMTEFWVPFAQSEELDNVLYGSLRMMGDDQDNREGNLGVGYRQVIDANGFKGVAGVHGWLDRRITERGSKFNQVTLGTEWLGESVDVRLNGYIPLSDKREITIPNANPQGPELAGTGILVDTNGTVLEEPQGGFDLELGLELGQYSDFIRDHTDRFHVYAGGYYFDGPNTEDVAGWRTRVSADVTENIQFGARFQRDDVRGSQGFLEATFRFPFGHKKSYRKEGIRARLDESPERDIDIVTNETIIDTGDRVQVLNTTTGTAQEVLHVDNTAAGGGDGSAENPYNTLADAEAAASAHTIIYVNQGDGTDTNQDQGITLSQTGQQLIGSGTNFVYDSGKFTTENGANPTGTLIAAATSAPIISNTAGDGIRINADDITVAGVRVDSTTRHGILIQATAANVVENVNILNNRISNVSQDGLRVEASGIGAEVLNTNIDNNLINSSGRYNQLFFSLNSGRIEDAIFQNNSLDNSGLDNLYILNSDTSYIGNITLRNNSVANSQDDGIFILSRFNGIIEDISISNSNISGSTLRGIYANARNDAQLNNLIIEENIITSNGTFGIFLNDDSSNILTVDLGGGFGSSGNNSIFSNTLEEIRVDLDGEELKAENNWWGNIGGLNPAEIILDVGSTIDSNPFLTEAP